ncbi:hypothetical protein [Leifsonia lichenia]
MKRSRMLVGVPLAIVLALGVTPALTGCGIEGIVKDATGGNVDIGSKKVPSDFPSAVPLYDGDVVLGASVGSGDAEVWNVTVKLPDAKAYQDIQKQLADAGFTGEFGVTSPDGGGTGTFASDAYGVIVVVTSAGINGWVANYSVSRTPASTPTP